MSGRMGRTTAELNMREGPGLGHTVIRILPHGTLFDILDEAGRDWFHIAFEGQSGYVHSDYVQLPLAGKTKFEVGVLESPALTAPVVTALYEDTQLMVFDQDGEWLEVVALGLPGYVPADAVAFPRLAKTTEYVNLRAGASTDTKVLELLPPNLSLHVWEELVSWVYVADTIRSGYVHADYIEFVTEDDHEAQPGKPADDLVVPETEMSPPADQRISLGTNPSATERQVATIWNRLGGLLASLAAQLSIEPGVAVAVLAIESGGRAFDANGRMIIRFENHIFYDKWGHEHQETFKQHFQFNANQRWKDHRWRPSADEEWRTMHNSGQAGEWAVFNFACTLDATAAKLSISMGGPQIMGFNHHTIRYDSVDAMFTAFSTSERAQIQGFFDFVRGRNGRSGRLTALRNLDFETFAYSYNGPGQAARYGALMQAVYDTFKRLT